MKTLERFWQWHDAEKPEPVAALLALAKNVSQSARDTLGDAVSYIAARAGKPYALSFALEQHPGELRDLSLALCRALDAMDEAVPEGEAKALFLTTVDPALDERLLQSRAAMQMAADLARQPIGWVELQEPVVTPWYQPTTDGGLITRINDRLLAHDQAERGVLRDQYASVFETFDPFTGPPKHVRSRCVRSLEAQAENAECTRLLGPAECSECLSTPCRWNQGGWPEPGLPRDMRIIQINPDLTRPDCDALRGSSGILVRLAGRADDYSQPVLRYLLIDILDPGHIATTYADPEFGRRWDAWRAEREDVQRRNLEENGRLPEPVLPSRPWRASAIRSDASS